MSIDPSCLSYVYMGWDGYQTSLTLAIESLSDEQLSVRTSPEMRSVREVVLHIADGRIDWFRRIDAPDSQRLQHQINTRLHPPTTGRELADWLRETWQVIEKTLAQWTVDDLPVTFEHRYQNKTYNVSRQWVIWRIMAHDIHHGGQLSELLAMQGIFPLELTLLGGHLTEPEVVS